MRIRLKGYRKYFLKLLFSFVVVVLVPVGIMGIIWYSMIMNQEKNAFLRNESARTLSITEAIEREVNGIESGLAILQLDLAERAYNVTDSVRNKTLMAKSLAKFIKDYRVVYSVYYLESASGRLFSTASGYYDFSDFYDTEWFTPSETQYYSDRLPPRYNYDADFIERVRDTSMEAIFPFRKVLTVVTAGASGDYLAANVNIESLYQTIANSYRLDGNGGRLFFIGPDDGILYGPDDASGDASSDTSSEASVNAPVDEAPSRPFAVPVARTGGVVPQIAYRDGFVYFIAPLKYRDLYCAVSYPEDRMLTVSKGYGMYIAGICVVLILLLLAVSRIMANRLYKPIESLCSEIGRTPSGSGQDAREGEIETLRHVFKEMNSICVTAEQREAEYRATMLQASFRMLIDGLIARDAFLAGNAGFFEETRGYRFQIIMCKFLERPRGGDEREFGLFFVRFCELISNYLRAVARGVFVAVDADGFAMMYACPGDGELGSVGALLAKTMGDLAEYGMCLSASDSFDAGTDFVASIAACRDRVETAFFFGVPGMTPSSGMPRRAGALPRGEERAYACALADAIASGNVDLAARQVSSLRDELANSGNPAYATAVCSGILDSLGVDRSAVEPPRARTLDGMLGALETAIESRLDSSCGGGTMSGHYCEEAKRYLRENYMRYMNVTDVADFLGISYPYLSRIFRTQDEGNGKLGEYLNEIRIEKSKEFLSATNESLDAIARKVGYGNVQSFQRFFKKYEKMTPGEYRRLRLFGQSSRA